MPAPISGEKEHAIVRATLHEKPPDGERYWSCRSMARAQGVSHSTVQRVWARHDIDPYRVERQKRPPVLRPPREAAPGASPTSELAAGFRNAALASAVEKNRAKAEYEEARAAVELAIRGLLEKAEHDRLQVSSGELLAIGLPRRDGRDLSSFSPLELVDVKRKLERLLVHKRRKGGW
jgi:DNA-binding transcriptional MocR family regulator